MNPKRFTEEWEPNIQGQEVRSRSLYPNNHRSYPVEQSSPEVIMTNETGVGFEEEYSRTPEATSLSSEP